MSEDDDALLVALIDGELDEGARGALEARLAADANLRERLARLRDGGRPFAPAFKALLDEAPVERLKASLLALDGKEQRGALFRERFTFPAARLRAVAAVVLFCAGIAIGRFALIWPASEEANWRQAVAEYLSLYTPDTTFSSDADPQENELSRLGAKIGLTLTLDRISLPNLQFKGAQIFAYDGAPLGELAYADPTAGLVLFCIIHDSEPDAAVKAEKREGFAIASWARGGRGYMLIGRLPRNRIAELADSLRQRF